MKLQLFALLVTAVSAVAQGVTDKIAPEGEAPAGCKPTLDAEFEITIIPLKGMAKKDLAIDTRGTTTTTSSDHANLVLQLADGVLTDSHNRTGYIASNFQFQFDLPPQAGALYTAGFSACANGSLALGGSAVFWQCRSGTFHNLYDRWWAAQCEPVLMVAMPCGSAGVGGEPPSSSTVQPGPVVGTQVVTTTMVVPLSDGQPQVVTTTSIVYICQIGDGQVQGHTTPCVAASQIPDGQVQVTATVTTGIAESQLSDGQSGGGGADCGAACQWGCCYGSLGGVAGGGGGGGGSRDRVGVDVMMVVMMMGSLLGRVVWF
ncbi:hypothetical protein N658DRAFT_509948 [Parathielavia hyrcaniae]|uniref:Cell wall mannoprotein PIR1-like C-terminal domain-containing protein n=1 Tax=Parathielavia hyrcaniae TaxID=113614 RepID=A0AAN6PYZ6_9PEZI|nr:hypothetical protein N658DRAFT_509948 [Parathielavia hyrcaniae]